MAAPVKPQASLNDLAALLARSNQRRVEEVPEGWRTAEQWAKHWERAAVTARCFIKRFLNEGMMEQRRFRVMTNRGIYPVPHYKLKP